MSERLDQWSWWITENLKDERLREIDALVPQLTDKKTEPLSKIRLREALDGDWAVIATIFEDGKIRAMAELHVFATVTERKGQVDNVVVDEDYRRRHYGEKLICALLDRAFASELYPVDFVQLTSNPDDPERYAARKLYAKLGFSERYKGFFVIKRDEWLAKNGEEENVR